MLGVAMLHGDRFNSELARWLFGSDDIRSGRVDVDEVCNAFGVEASDVRQALRTMVAAGYLSVSPRGDFHVPAVDRGAVLEACDLLALIEGRAIDMLVLAINSRSIQALEIELAEMRYAHDIDDPVAFTLHDSRFHALLGAEVGRQHRHVMGDLWRVTEPGRLRYACSAFRRESEIDEHQALISAYRVGDSTRMRVLLDGHRIVGCESAVPSVR